MVSGTHLFKTWSSMNFLALFLFTICLLSGTVSAHAQICYSGSQQVSVSNGEYTVQNDEWNSTAAECITVNMSATGFTVAQSSLSHTNTTRGDQTIPSGYLS